MSRLGRRAALIVLDGVGIGPAPDTDAYGDTGSDTLGNVARAVGGYVVAWYPSGGGNVRVQGFSEALAPQGEPLSLPLLTNGVENLSVSFVGGQGVVGAGSSLYLVTLDRGMNVSLTRRVDFPRVLLRQAWLASESLAHGVLADGRFVLANATA